MIVKMRIEPVICQYHVNTIPIGAFIPFIAAPALKDNPLKRGSLDKGSPKSHKIIPSLSPLICSHHISTFQPDFRLTWN